MRSKILMGAIVGGGVLTGIAGNANAESSVVIYGQVEQSIARVSADTPVKTRITQVNPSGSGSSLIGFRGSEDLGGDLSAIFVLEAAMAPDTGFVGSASAASGTNPAMNSFFNRLSYVGLSSKQLGTVKLGRGFTPTIQTLLNANVIRPSYNTGLTTTIASQGLGNDFYNSNMIRYESPAFAGLSVQGHVAMGEVPIGAKGGDSYGLAGRYVQSFLTFTGAHHVTKDQAGNQVKWNAATVAGEYGSARFTAGFNRMHVPQALQSAAPSTYRDSKMRLFGASYRVMDPLTLSAQYSDVKYMASGSSSQQRVLSANYALSRRTSLYVLAASVKSGAVGIAAINGFAAFPNVSAKAYAFGVNHSF